MAQQLACQSGTTARIKTKGPLRLALLLFFLAIGSRAQEGVQMIMPNGTRVVVEAEDIAVDVADATGRALPEDEGELKNLLNWAISKHLVLCISCSALTFHSPRCAQRLQESFLAGRFLCMCPGQWSAAETYTLAKASHCHILV